MSDYVISSYTPTLAAHLSPHLPSGPFKMTFAMESATLHYTMDELSKVQRQIPKRWLEDSNNFTVLSSVQEVVQHLRLSSIVHFACHGIQNMAKPLDSALVLNDGKLKVSEIIKEEFRAQDASKLAFLCACQTALGDEKLPDEVLHLAATLLFAGFQGTVATMWCVFLLFFLSVLTNCFPSLTGQ